MRFLEKNIGIWKKLNKNVYNPWNWGSPKGGGGGVCFDWLRNLFFDLLVNAEIGIIVEISETIVMIVLLVLHEALFLL